MAFHLPEAFSPARPPAMLAAPAVRSLLAVEVEAHYSSGAMRNLEGGAEQWSLEFSVGTETNSPFGVLLSQHGEHRGPAPRQCNLRMGK